MASMRKRVVAIWANCNWQYEYVSIILRQFFYEIRPKDWSICLRLFEMLPNKRSHYLRIFRWVRYNFIFIWEINRFRLEVLLVLKVNPDSLAVNFQTVDFVRLNWQLIADSYPHVKFEVLVTSGNGTPRQYSTLNTFLDLPCNGISDSDVTIKITTCMQPNVEEANKECDGNPAEMKIYISCPSQQRPSTSVTKDIIDKSNSKNVLHSNKIQ